MSKQPIRFKPGDRVRNIKEDGMLKIGSDYIVHTVTPCIDDKHRQVIHILHGGRPWAYYADYFVLAETFSETLTKPDKTDMFRFIQRELDHGC